MMIDSRDADKPYDILDQVLLSNGGKAFYAARQAPLPVFYQSLVEHTVAPGTTPTGNYNRLFQLVCGRTSALMPGLDIYAVRIECPASIQNQRIFGLVLDYFRNFGVDLIDKRHAHRMPPQITRCHA
jgi:hypothetical protein